MRGWVVLHGMLLQKRQSSCCWRACLHLLVHVAFLPGVIPPLLPPPLPHAHLLAVTRAEAGQSKRLLLLDRAAGWEMADQLPLDIGPRYFVAAAARVADSAGAPASAGAAADAVAAVDGEAAAAEVAVAEAAAAAEAEGAAAAFEPAFELQLPEGLRRGDRLLLTLPAAAAKQHAKQLRKLEKQGGWRLGLCNLRGALRAARAESICLHALLPGGVHHPEGKPMSCLAPIAYTVVSPGFSSHAGSEGKCSPHEDRQNLSCLSPNAYTAFHGFLFLQAGIEVEVLTPRRSFLLKQVFASIQVYFILHTLPLQQALRWRCSPRPRRQQPHASQRQRAWARCRWADRGAVSWSGLQPAYMCKCCRTVGAAGSACHPHSERLLSRFIRASSIHPPSSGASIVAGSACRRSRLRRGPACWPACCGALRAVRRWSSRMRRLSLRLWRLKVISGGSNLDLADAALCGD